SSTPEVLIVAPVTVSPGATSTGTDSPVSIASSIAEWPVSTSPSVAIFSPGRTRKTSPTTSSSIGTCTSVRGSCAVPDPDAAPAGPDPSRSTVADFAPRSSRALSAADARVFALSSVRLPMSRNTVIAAAASNHTWYSAGFDQPQPSSTARPRVTYEDAPARMTTTLTRVSTVVGPPRAALYAPEGKGQAPQVATGRARIAAIHCPLAKCQPMTIEIATIGTARIIEPMKRGLRCRG